MGLFDELFGMGAPAAPGAPPAPGLGDRMMNPMTQMGLALLSNHGTLKSQRGMFDGVGEAGIRAQVYGDARREKAEAKAEKNKTLEFLRQQHPDIASLVDGGLDVGEAFNYALQRQNVAADNARADRAFGLQQAELGREQAGWNATAKYLESQGADLSLVQLAQAGQGGEAIRLFGGTNGSARLSTQPVWGTDADGNPVLGQLSDDGRFVPSQLPEGVSPLGPQDLNAQRSRGTTLGKIGAEQEAAAPSDLQSGLNALDLIQDLRTDPNRARGTGGTSIFNSIPASGGYDYQNKVNQAKAGAFLRAIESLQGMGALSNAEGATATSAITRMDTATSEEAFVDALDDYEKIVRQGIARSQRRMGGGSAPAPAAGGADDPLGLR